MFPSKKSHKNSKMNHVGSKTKSQGQILEKPCIRSRGHIFSHICLKLGQNDRLNKNRGRVQEWVMFSQKLGH